MTDIHSEEMAMSIAEKLETAKAEVAKLEREAAQMTCSERGYHRWKSIGGANCGCHRNAACSVPVHKCEDCGDCDYGENAAANATRVHCAELRVV